MDTTKLYVVVTGKNVRICKDLFSSEPKAWQVAGELAKKLHTSTKVVTLASRQAYCKEHYGAKPVVQTVKVAQQPKPECPECHTVGKYHSTKCSYCTEIVDGVVSYVKHGVTEQMQQHVDDAVAKHIEWKNIDPTSGQQLLF